MEATATTATPTTDTTFTVGRTYTFRFASNYESIGRCTVTARTAKFITFDYLGKSRRTGVTTSREGVEISKPLGTYSMCPFIEADRYETPVSADYALEGLTKDDLLYLHDVLTATKNAATAGGRIYGEHGRNARIRTRIERRVA